MTDETARGAAMTGAGGPEKGGASGAIGQALSPVTQGDYFRWFNLTAEEAPREIGGGRVWHGYRPAGPKFHDLVTVNIETDPAGAIDRATLCLDRYFIERPSDAPFARDITRSFLLWALPEADRIAVGALIDEIGDLRHVATPVIRRAGHPEPELPQFPSPGYRTFLGYQGDHDQSLGATALRLVNLNWQRRQLDVATPPGYDAETKWFWLIVRRCS